MKPKVVKKKIEIIDFDIEDEETISLELKVGNDKFSGYVYMENE